MTPNLEEPKTIEELRAWFKERGYEPAKTRFFVGVDIRSPKAFGIYLDEFGEYVVYKNKADGTRAIRYQGYDEEFAVHELYQRFQEEIINQQTRWTAAGQQANRGADMQADSRAFDAYDLYEMKKQRNERGKMIPLILVLIVLSFILTLKFMIRLQTTLKTDLGLLKGFAPLIVTVLIMLFSWAWLNGTTVTDFVHSLSRKQKNSFYVAILMYMLIFVVADTNVQSNGYYSINNNLYYRAGSNWYRYDDSGRDWERSYSVPSQLTSSSWKDYNNTGSHHGSYESFENTIYYTNWSSEQRRYSENRDDDYDNDHYDNDSWSSDDWDSGYTDWNSDW